MKNLKDIKALVVAALLAAFTCIATMVIQIPTPTLGYIHLGDSIVLLCGFILGPILGGLAAGIGSMLADILTGYAIYAIPTLIIKFITAMIAGFAFRKLRKHINTLVPTLIVSGFLAELNMVFGYFINKIIQTLFMAGSCNSETLAAGLTSAIAGIGPNCIQGLVGIIIASAILPLLSKVPDIKVWIDSEH